MNKIKVIILHKVSSSVEHSVSNTINCHLLVKLVTDEHVTASNENKKAHHGMKPVTSNNRKELTQKSLNYKINHYLYFSSAYYSFRSLKSHNL